MIVSGALGVIARAASKLPASRVVRFELSQRSGLVYKRFFGLLLARMQAQQAFAGFPMRIGAALQSALRIRKIWPRGTRRVLASFPPGGPNARFSAQQYNRLNLRSARRFPSAACEVACASSRVNLGMTAGQLLWRAAG